ncbi:MAG: response regulator transcription factor [Acidobacteriota bacterium]
MTIDEIRTLNILVIDDKTMVRELIVTALSQQPGFEVAGTALDNSEGLEEAFTTEHDIVLLDMDMADYHVCDVIRSIFGMQPESRILVLTSNMKFHEISEIFNAGACGFIHKKAAFKEILMAIKTVLKHKCFISPLLNQELIRMPAVTHRDTPPEVLSMRQREVLALIAEGKPIKEIAHNLNLNVRTVHLHRKNLVEKLGMDKVADLTRYAYRNGLV